jgi:DNA-binding GntR family transcriptional regulator
MEILDLRAMMDEATGRQLALTITPEQLRQLRASVDAMERAVKAGDADGYHLMNLAFHDAMVSFTGNRKLIALYRRLINELSLFRRLNLADAGLLPLSANEHRAIVKAIAAGDADTAGRAMRQHVLDSKERTQRNNTPPAAKAPARKKVSHA